MLKFYDHDQIDFVQPLAASANVQKYDACGRTATGLRPLQAGDPFAGFAFFDAADNTGGAAGAKSIQVRTRGHVRAPITGVALTNLGDKVYMSGRATFTLTPTNNSLIGSIVAVPETGVAIVRYEPLVD